MVFVLSVVALAVVYVVVGVVERRPGLRFRRLSSPRPYLATDTTWYLVAVGATAVSVFVFRPVFARLSVDPIADWVGDLPLVIKFLVGLLAFDLVSFLVHVGLHRSDSLWNFHKVHHSTLELDSFATTRTHLFENLVRFVPGQLAMFVIGMPAGLVTGVVALAGLYGISNHSNVELKIKWIEAILVTPRIHRRHHVPSTTQCNYGTIFTVWDRLVGTLVRRDTTDDERFGVPGEIDTYPQHFGQAVRQPFVQVAELRAARRRAGAGRRDAEKVDA